MDAQRTAKRRTLENRGDDVYAVARTDTLGGVQTKQGIRGAEVRPSLPGPVKPMQCCTCTWTKRRRRKLCSSDDQCWYEPARLRPRQLPGHLPT